MEAIVERNRYQARTISEPSDYRRNAMATVNPGTVDEAMQDITAGIPGPQEGETVFGYRSRLNRRFMEIVDAVSNRKKLADAFIRNNSNEKLRPTEQFYNAVRKRFIVDEFED